MIDTIKTLPEILRFIEVQYDNPLHFNYLQEGRWAPLSTKEITTQVRQLALALQITGLKPGQGVGILVDPSPQWLMMDLAIISAGGVSVPMFANVSTENLKFEIADANVKILFLPDEKALQTFNPHLSGIEKVILLSGRATDVRAVTYQNLVLIGKGALEKDPESFSRLVQAVGENDLATIIYTSGSMGVPKGAEITHKNLISQIQGASIRFPMDPKVDKMLTVLPFAHVLERMVIYFYTTTGCSIYFADDIKKAGEYLRQVHPTVVTMVPRILEKVHARMVAGVESARGVKKLLAGAAFKRARRRDPEKDAAGFVDKLFDRLVYHKLREALGGNLRLVIYGSAPLSPELGRFFMNVGLPLYEGYGLTESSPVLAVNFPGHRRRGSVGPIFPGVDVKISPTGEILAKGPNIMRGYHNNPQATRAAIDGEGWLHTGDLGKIDADGNLWITGRIKELFKTSNGKYVSPVPIEQSLAQHPFVDMAAVVAEGHRFVSCLLFPNFEGLKAYKERCGHGAVGDLDFIRSPFVKNEMDKLIAGVNQRLNHWEQVQKYFIVPAPVSIETGELTPSMKLRRHVLETKFKSEIVEMYKEDNP